MKAIWNRFTLMDGGILIGAFALGMGLASHFIETDTPFHQVYHRVVWMVSSILWGGAIAGPLILSAQWVRGRRSALSWGEWLWLAPSSLFLVSYALAFSGDASLDVMLLWVMAQCFLSFIAFCWITASLCGLRPDVVACRWADHLGCTVCALYGPAIGYAIYEALSQV